jgi:hypothetical protein
MEARKLGRARAYARSTQFSVIFPPETVEPKSFAAAIKMLKPPYLIGGTFFGGGDAALS